VLVLAQISITRRLAAGINPALTVPESFLPAPRRFASRSRPVAARFGLLTRSLGAEKPAIERPALSIEPSPGTVELPPFSIEAPPFSIERPPRAIEAFPFAIELPPLAIEREPFSVETLPFSIERPPPIIESSPFRAEPPTVTSEPLAVSFELLPFTIELSPPASELPPFSSEQPPFAPETNLFDPLPRLLEFDQTVPVIEGFALIPKRAPLQGKAVPRHRQGEQITCRGMEVIEETGEPRRFKKSFRPVKQILCSTVTDTLTFLKDRLAPSSSS
jgi:hypothetical protein